MARFTGATIALPVVDEIFSVDETVRIITDVCRPEDIREFLLFAVDEKTARKIDGLPEKYPQSEIRIIVQRHPHIGGVIRDAIDEAKGSHLMTFPSDLDLDPACTAEMIRLCKQSPEKIITTSRWLIKDNFKKYNSTKRIFNFLGQKFLAALFNPRLTDISSPTQIAPLDVYRSIAWERYDFPFLLEVSLKPLRLGVEFAEVPIRFYSMRQEGKSNNSFKNTALYLPVALHNRFMPKSKIIKKN